MNEDIVDRVARKLIEEDMKQLEEKMKKISIQLHSGRIDPEDALAEMQVHQYDLDYLRKIVDG